MAMIYVDFDATSDSGIEEKHDNWLVVDNFSFGVGRDVTALRLGQTPSDNEDLPSFGEINIRKAIDPMSPGIFSEVWNNKFKKIVKIHLMPTATDYLEIVLEDVLINSYAINADIDVANKMQENCSLSFGKISMKFVSLTNKEATLPAQGFNLVVGKPI